MKKSDNNLFVRGLIPFMFLAFVFVALFIFRDQIKSFWDLFRAGRSQEKANPMMGVADTLHQAMKYRGTDEEIMLKALKPLTGAQLLNVYEAFGKRPYSNYWLGGGGSNVSLLGGDLDLFGWFKEEMSGKELLQMRDIWQKSGLTLTF